MLRVSPVHSDIRVRVSEGVRDISGVLEREVEAIWIAEQERRGSDLFNGQIFCVEDFAEDGMTGRFVEYRLWVAQLVKPELYETLRLRPLATSGLLLCPSGLVFGLRGSGSTQDGGKWELVPSGGIDQESPLTSGAVDVCHNLSNELEEELGLSSDKMIRIKPFCLVEDTDSHVIDIGIELVTGIDPALLHQAHDVYGSREYTEIKLVSLDSLESFSQSCGEQMSAVSRALMQECSLISQ